MDEVRICRHCTYAIKRRSRLHRWVDGWGRRHCRARRHMWLGHSPAEPLPGFVGMIKSARANLACEAKNIVRDAQQDVQRQRDRLHHLNRIVAEDQELLDRLKRSRRIQPDE